MIHLDTSFLIRALGRNSPEERLLRRWFKRGEPVRISAVTWTEFLCGPVRARQMELVQQLVDEPVAFVSDDSLLAATLFNLGGRRRGSLLDCMIAATAIRSRASLATTDPVDFQRFESAGLSIVAV